jgi:16S rRNA (guanine966-N2)-methyltransferase
MRIIGGNFKGRKLVAPEGLDTRPTSDAHRETVFNVICNGLAHEMNHVLDLFAGTGALALEALSRGAEHATFIEKNPKALACMAKNIGSCQLSASQYGIVKDEEISKWAKKLAAGTLDEVPFDTIFCDPPYRKRFVEKALAGLESEAAKLFIKNRTLLIVETASDENLPQLSESWSLIKDREKGSTRLLFYRRV